MNPKYPKKETYVPLPWMIESSKMVTLPSPIPKVPPMVPSPKVVRVRTTCPSLV